MVSVAVRQFERYAPDVYAWAYRLLGRHHDALDVVQDVFVRWAEQCAVNAPRQPRGWLRRVTVNRAIDVRRHRRAGRQTGDEPIATAVAPDISGDTIDQAALRDDVAAALDRLTDVQRAVLVAKVYDQMTFARIAGELDLSVSTVKTHYLRAVRAVRDRLWPRWGDEE